MIATDASTTETTSQETSKVLDKTFSCKNNRSDGNTLYSVGIIIGSHYSSIAYTPTHTIILPDKVV